MNINYNGIAIPSPLSVEGQGPQSPNCLARGSNYPKPLQTGFIPQCIKNNIIIFQTDLMLVKRQCGVYFNLHAYEHQRALENITRSHGSLFQGQKYL